jgi:D-3-phosphoglycerate dehydrogenase / 2-oxoglutarate reductase
MAQYKVVITDFSEPDCDLEAEELQASGLDIELVRLNTRVPEELIPHVVDADALIVQWCQITRPVMEAMTRCRAVSRYGIGVDMVDQVAATDHHIMVVNVPDFCIEEVSTSTIGFIINLNRHIWLHHAHIRAGKWGTPPGGAPARLQGQTVGVVGLGNIGRAVAKKAACLGLNVIGYDPYIKPEQLAGVDVTLVGLDELLKQSDYVTLHCPLVAETRHLIGAAQLAQMKPTAYLVNMSRGPVVDQPALYQALVQGTIAGAALDVLEQEPPAADDPLLQLDNIIITPHTSSWSLQAVTQLRRQTARNVVTVLRGEIPASVVNRRGLGL